MAACDMDITLTFAIVVCHPPSYYTSPNDCLPSHIKFS